MLINSRNTGATVAGSGRGSALVIWGNHQQVINPNHQTGSTVGNAERENEVRASNKTKLDQECQGRRVDAEFLIFQNQTYQHGEADDVFGFERATP
jgi:hypothetical protein